MATFGKGWFGLRLLFGKLMWSKERSRLRLDCSFAIIVAWSCGEQGKVSVLKLMLECNGAVIMPKGVDGKCLIARASYIVSR